PVKVSVISCAYERVQSDGAPLYKRCLESLYTKAVQCRRPVQQNRVFLDHFLKYIPHFWVNTFNFSFSRFDIMSDSFATNSFMMNGLKSSNAISFGKPH